MHSTCKNWSDRKIIKTYIYANPNIVTNYILDIIDNKNVNRTLKIDDFEIFFLDKAQN